MPAPPRSASTYSRYSQIIEKELRSAFGTTKLTELTPCIYEGSLLGRSLTRKRKRKSGAISYPDADFN